MKSAAPPSHLRRNLWIVAVLLALFTIIGFVVVPPILKSQLEKRLSAELGRTVTVGTVRFNPYAFSLTLENFDIRAKEGKDSFLGWNRLYVDFDLLSSLTGDWVLDQIELDGFHVEPVIQADGILNFSDILAKLEARPKDPVDAKPGRPLRVGSLKVRQARVEFGDLSRKTPFKSKIGPLTFALTGFRTVGSRGAPYHLEAVTEAGEKLAWSGTLSADPVASKGDFQIADLILKKYTPYVEDKIQADLTDGKLNIKGSYEIALGGTQRVMKLKDGEVHLRDLKMEERSSHQPAVELAVLDVAGVQADAMEMKATVGSVTLTGGKITARREKDGSLNLVTMMQPEKPVGEPSPAPAGSSAKAPDISVAQVALNDFQIDATDLAASRPVQLGLTGIQFSLKDVTLADGAVMPVDLSVGLTSTGTVHVAGTVSIKPSVKADLKAEVNGLEVLPFSPYLEQFVNARLTQGSVTTDLEVKAEMAAGQPLAATAIGEVTLNKFALVDGVKNEELAGVGAILLKGLKVATAPQLSIALDEVNIAGPYARVMVAKDKSLNLAAIAKTGDQPATEIRVPTVGNEAAPRPKITISRVVLSGGEFSFTDQSIEPNVRTAINQFAGTITGLSSENLAKAGVDLKATVDGAGPVAITGQLDPLGAKKFVDLKIDFKNVDLQPLSPYSGKYAGYELARGKLVLDVKFRLDDKKIDAHDVITLNQFTFGGATNSPEATHLPVRLGVALLKDTDGKIVIDVPIQGNTDDPNFRIGKVVLRVVVNLLTKAAVSPFSLLGSMFGGGGEELAYQEFSPGATALQPAEVKKLETMVTALTNRPALSVALEGSYDGPADTFALKRQKLAETVRRAIWDQKHAISPAISPPEQLVITPEENAAMVKQLFDAKFPPGTEFGAPLVKAPEAVAAPPPAKRGFFGKVADVVTLKKLRGEKKEKEADTPAEIKNVEPAGTTGPSLEEMSGRLAEATEVGENDLRALATARAQRVRDYFINVGKVDPERLFLAKGPADPTKTAKGPRVFLGLQ